jgi:hypothetical protein
MKRNIILALLFFLALGGMLLARGNMIIKVKVQTANVRSGPDASAPIVARAAAGTLLEVAGKEGAWYEVNVSDQSGKEVTGYIRDSVVEVVGNDEEETAAAESSSRAAYRRDSSAAGAGSSMRFGINFGAMTDDTFSFNPFVWTAGAELDFQFGNFLMFCPLPGRHPELHRQQFFLRRRGGQGLCHWQRHFRFHRFHVEIECRSRRQKRQAHCLCAHGL